MRYFVVFLLLWSAVSDFFTSKLSFLGFVDELIVIVLLIDLLLHAIVKANKRYRQFHYTLTGILIVVLLGWSILSFIINWSSFSQLFKFILSISKGFIIYYWLKTFLRGTRIVSEIVSIIKWLIIIQIPFFVLGLIILRGDYIGDNAVGAVITGDASAVGTYFWMGIMICIGKFEIHNKKRYLCYALALAFLLIVTSTKQLTVMLPVALIYLYGRRIRIVNLKKIAFIAVGALLVIMLYNAVERKWMLNYGVDTSETNLVDYMDESEKLLGYYSLLYELPSEINYPLLLGAGPGMYGSYVAMNARVPLSQKYIMYYYDLIPEGLGGTLAYRSSSVIGFWGDIGLVGLSLVLAIYIYLTFDCARKMKAVSKRIQYNLIISVGFLILAQSFILNIFEGNTFTLNLFWILCGISVSSNYGSSKNISETCA